MSQANPWTSDPFRSHWAELTRGLRTLGSAAPALLYGVRLSTAVCLSLYVAFWLELDNAYWAGLTAAIICQPSLGASLRKARFYVIGTQLAPWLSSRYGRAFPQDRLASCSDSRCGALHAVSCLRCCATSRLLQPRWPASPQRSSQAANSAQPAARARTIFMLALTRASEVCIGILSAALVLSWTDFGAARRRLAAQLAAISAEIAGGLGSAFSLSPSGCGDTRPVQRDLIGRVIALDRVIDEAVGESSSLRLHASILQGAVDGLFAALSGWRMATVQLEQLPIDQRRREADAIQRHLTQELKSGEATAFDVNPLRARQAVVATVRALTALTYRTPSLRLLADHAAEALIGVRRALDGLLLLADRSHAVHGLRTARFLCARLASLSGEFGAHFRHDRRGRALLGRDRMAERRSGDHFRGYLCVSAYAARRSSSRHRDGLLDRRLPHRGCRRHRQVRGAA